MVARPLVLALSLALTSAAAADKPALLAQPPPAPATDRAFERVVKKVAAMVESESAYAIAAGYGLQILNVLWEDTGRWEGSAVGPNISDVTIEVEGFRQGKRHRSYLMPVMRHDNFTDKTADVKMDNILIPVGNQAGGPLHLVTLTELLKNPLQYLSASDRGTIKGNSLWARRDTHALVSAQHAFLPVPHSGQATFWPVIFNYQSTKTSPAVLTILVTRQGTSITIIDNARDTVTGGDSWGQRLYFNQGGKKAPLIAERMADVQATGVTANGEAAQTLTDDANVLMLIQVPLKVRAPRYLGGVGSSAGAGPMAPMAPTAAPSKDKAMASSGDEGRSRRDTSDVDTAVLGHGATEGPYTELDGRTIQRDARFPVRVTLQFYQATSNGVVSRANVKMMAAQIRKVYAKGDYVGSLVVPSGIDRQRPTNWTGVSRVADLSWRTFPGLVERLSLTLLRPRTAI